MAGKWKSMSEPPKKNGRYLVKFYFKDRHETDRTEIAYRDFTDGVWSPPYLDRANEGSELAAWLDEEAKEQGYEGQNDVD